MTKKRFRIIATILCSILVLIIAGTMYAKFVLKMDFAAFNLNILNKKVAFATYTYTERQSDGYERGGTVRYYYRAVVPKVGDTYTDGKGGTYTVKAVWRGVDKKNLVHRTDNSNMWNERLGDSQTAVKRMVTKIDFVDKIKFEDGAEFFSDMYLLNKIENIQNFDTSRMTSMRNMFNHATELDSIDLRYFDTRNVTDMGYMFYLCKDLVHVDFSNFDMTNVTKSESMFAGCLYLESITTPLTFKGTPFPPFNYKDYTVPNELEDDIAFKGINGYLYEHGYLSPNLEKAYDGIWYSASGRSYNHNQIPTKVSDTYYAVAKNNFAVYTESDRTMRFYRGVVAAPDEGSTFNGQVVTIVWDNVENMYTDTQTTPLWIKAEIKDVKTVEFVDKVSFTSGQKFFADMNSLATLNNLQNFDTRKMTSMYGMFNNCWGIDTIDLTTFDTSNVTDMGYMFYNCSKLNSIEKLTQFNTSKVTNMSNMFGLCKHLAELDISSFDMAKVTDTTAMYSSCHRLAKITVGTGFELGTANFPAHDTYKTASTPDTEFVQIPGTWGKNWYKWGTGSPIGYKNITKADPNNGEDKVTYYAVNKRAYAVYGENTVTNKKGLYIYYDNDIPWTLTELDTKTDTTYTAEKLDADRNIVKVEKIYDFLGIDAYNAPTMTYGSNGTDGDPFNWRNVWKGKTDVISAIEEVDVVTELNAANGEVVKFENGLCEGLFAGMTSLVTCDLSQITTNGETTMTNMFTGCAALETLDIRKFDMTLVTNPTEEPSHNMLAGCDALKKLVLGFDCCAVYVDDRGTIDNTTDDLKYPRPRNVPAYSEHDSRKTIDWWMIGFDQKYWGIDYNGVFDAFKDTNTGTRVFYSIDSEMRDNILAQIDAENIEVQQETLDLLEEEEEQIGQSIEFDFWTGIDDSNMDWWPTAEDPTIYVGMDYTLAFEAYEGYRLDDYFKVLIDDTEYKVPTTALSDETDVGELALWFDTELGELTIPADVLTEEVQLVTIYATAVPITEDSSDKDAAEDSAEDATEEEVEDSSGDAEADSGAEDTENTDTDTGADTDTDTGTDTETDTDTDTNTGTDTETDTGDNTDTEEDAKISVSVDIDGSSIDNLQLKDKDGNVIDESSDILDKSGNAVIKIELDKGYVMPAEFAVTIAEKTYIVKSNGEENQDGMSYDSKTGTLTIPKDLLNGEDIIITFDIAPMWKPEDDKDTTTNPDTQKPDGEGKDETDNTGSTGSTGTTEGTEGAGSTDGTGTTEGTGNTDVTGGTDNTTGAGNTEGTGSTDNKESTGNTESTENTEGAGSTENTEGSGNTDSTETTEGSGSTDSIDSTDSTDTTEGAGSTGSTEGIGEAEVGGTETPDSGVSTPATDQSTSNTESSSTSEGSDSGNDASGGAESGNVSSGAESSSGDSAVSTEAKGSEE